VFYSIKTGKAPLKEPCKKKTTPFFHSPSVPSFKIFDDEDDFGNYDADPNLRHLVGSSSGTCCLVDRAMDMVYIFFPSFLFFSC
jgi:hypothetical protein